MPEGDYYFQVTDPSGKDLLSTDHISCRKIHVNEFGVIDFVYAGTNHVKVQGNWTAVPCQHNQGVDVDHSELGAITLQLYPYDDTPNPGGVYKALVTPVDDYAGPMIECSDKGQCNVNGEEYQPGSFHGFIPAKSKTDNYKVKEKGKPYEPPVITVRKFHDKNFNGIWEAGEEEVTGWEVELLDPLGVTTTLYTPETVLADTNAGDIYTFTEATPAGTMQTASYLDGSQTTPFPTNPVEVVIQAISGETHHVLFGNVGLGDVTACKVYDRNGDGMADEGEPGIEGWKMALSGTLTDGSSYGPAYQFTGTDGCTTFSGLLPGAYTVAEIIPSGDWMATSDLSFDFTIISTLSGASMSGGSFSFTFTNFCVGCADFGTKGYWHNKNGLSELTTDDRDYVNGLSPYAAPSTYFGAGDEPFDGYFTDGTPVAAAFNADDGSLIWGAGTWQAEVSHFLVDSNAGGDPREQLAQQLLAFIFNSRHRLDDPSATIVLPDGSTISASDLVSAAILVWESGSAAEQTAMQELLNALNESDALPYIHYFPCAVSY